MYYLFTQSELNALNEYLAGIGLGGLDGVTLGSEYGAHSGLIAVSAKQINTEWFEDGGVWPENGFDYLYLSNQASTGN